MKILVADIPKQKVDPPFIKCIYYCTLLGYGFSDGAVRPGLSSVEMAVVFKNLMKRVGYDKFYIQGGDWGGIIVQQMSVLFPEHVIGAHSNMCFVNTPLSSLKLIIGSYFPSLITSDKDEQERMFPASKTYAYLMLESGYMHLQATKPDTVGKCFVIHSFYS